MKILLYATITTDKDGNFEFDPGLKVYLILASHNNYWDGHTGGNSNSLGDFTLLGNVYLTPLAHTKIHLKKINAHPSNLLLLIILDEDPAPVYSPGLQS